MTENELLDTIAELTELAAAFRVTQNELLDTIDELTELPAAFRFHLKLQPGNEGIKRSLAGVHANIVALRADLDDLYAQELYAQEMTA